MKSPIVFLHDTDIEKYIENVFESDYFKNEDIEDFEITQDFLNKVVKEVQTFINSESTDAMMFWSYLEHMIAQAVKTVIWNTVLKQYTIFAHYISYGKDREDALKHFFKDYKDIPIDQLEWDSEISFSQNSKGMWRKDWSQK